MKETLYIDKASLLDPNVNLVLWYNFLCLFIILKNKSYLIVHISSFDPRYEILIFIPCIDTRIFWKCTWLSPGNNSNEIIILSRGDSISRFRADKWSTWISLDINIHPISISISKNVFPYNFFWVLCMSLCKGLQKDIREFSGSVYMLVYLKSKNHKVRTVYWQMQIISFTTDMNRYYVRNFPFLQLNNLLPGMHPYHLP